ncbi:hypothetical protein E8E13_005551 [Curvularia kusanoi]|uniref:Xylanolytic transcriptional activator regulatory domain-containing protein n=1 Tax=Curvularia kusanoi TaxID=90978 RepID=A0A9P4T833_CURKU|nr:hypothetical protein E8E13_005551 [Curvularia kusanoi]
MSTSTSTSTVTPNSNAPRSRQQPGLACDECRRHTTCVTTTTRQPRGPRKGHLRALQSRIIALERRLSSEGIEDTGEEEFIRFPDETDTFSGLNQQNFPDIVAPGSRDGLEPEGSNSSGSNGCSVDFVFSQPISNMALPLTGLSSINFISDLMRSDLNHLYFDRVHSFFPILSKRHYFARARQSTYGSEQDSFQCLQHAMWTLAVSTSSQFQHIQDDLYSQTRLLIDNLEMKQLQADCIEIEQVQAWGLLAVYEFMRIGYRKAWMSAGKFFRYAVLMKLHNVDGIDGLAAAPLQNLSFIELEERRRTFWMAYTIDHITSLLDRLPLTFDQHVILTRLPCPEKDFQSDEPVVMKFLPSPLLQSDNKAPSTFTDSIQLVAICGQLLSHQQQGVFEHTHGLISMEFWERQQQLDARLEQALKGMCLNDPYNLIFQDPMAYFTALAAQSSALMLYKSSQTAPWGMKDSIEVAAECEKRAIAAAQQMTILSKALIELCYFKIHPFTPVLLYLCGDFLSSNPHLDPTFEMQLALQSVLNTLSHVNLTAKECLDRLHMVQ